MKSQKKVRSKSRFFSRPVPQSRAASHQSRLQRFRKACQRFVLPYWRSQQIVDSVCRVFRRGTDLGRLLHRATGSQLVSAGNSTTLRVEGLEQRHMLSAVSLVASYSQDFDTLVASGSSSVLPAGWEISETGTSSYADGQYTAGTGSSNTGDSYSFGSSGSTERALGGLQSGTLNPTFGASFQNDSGQTITELTIAFTGEQWRLGTTGRVDQIDFQYSTDATSLTDGTWTDVDSLDFVAPVTNGSTGALDGNLPANQTAVTATISSLNIASGDTFYIRWTDHNADNADDGFAVDDFAIVASSIGNTYVDDDWSAFSAGDVIADADPGTLGDQAAIFGTNAFATIQDAVDAVEAGGTVTVSAGTYAEVLDIDKPVTIAGAGEASTIVQGGFVLRDGADGTTIQDLTIQDSSSRQLANHRRFQPRHAGRQPHPPEPGLRRPGDGAQSDPLQRERYARRNPDARRF